MDERGEIPNDIKRGVLSEDGIHDMLERNKEIMDMLGNTLEEADNFMTYQDVVKKAQDTAIIRGEYGNRKVRLYPCDTWLKGNQINLWTYWQGYQYEKIQELLSISKDEANKMPTADGTFSLKQWKMVHEFFERKDIDISDIEPSKLEYKEVQREQIEITIEHEKDSLKGTDSKLRDHARRDAAPTLNEAVKVIGVAAAFEGGTALTLSIVKKKKEGKNIKDFSSDDWKEIYKDAGVGTVKGGIRGASIYALTNYTATPAAMANAIVTASFGVAEQAHLYRKGELDETQFISNAEMLCLDASVSALSSLLGQAVIPIPIIGALIGNAVGTTLYKIAKDGLSDKEKALIKSYLDDIETLKSNLDEQYQKLVVAVQKEYEQYMLILEKLYSVDYMKAFEGSCEMAKFCGVPSNDILDSKESIEDYFLS